MNKIDSLKPIKLLLSLLAITCFFLQLLCTNEMEDKQPDPKDSPTKIVPKSPKPEYTEEDAGEWDSLKADHLPIVVINTKSKKDNIEIQVFGIDNCMVATMPTSA